MANSRGIKRSRIEHQSSNSLTKRARTKPPSDDPPKESPNPPPTNTSGTPPPDYVTAYEHDAKYYFDDGDTILRISNTLFRVHREKLQNVKGLFQHLFSLPQPEGGVEGTDTIYGIPCCKITLVSPSDMHFAIGYIYEDVHLHSVDKKGRDWYHWDASIALLRVGSKLELPDLRRSAIDLLKKLFPAELDESDGPKNIVQPLQCELFYRLYPIETINAGRVFDVPLILPTALYKAAQLSFTDIVTGVERKDGTRAKLCEDDILRVIQGREELLLSRRHTIFSFLNKFTDTGKPSKPTPKCIEQPMRGGETCFYWLLRMNLDFNASGFIESSAMAMNVLPSESQDVIKSHLCDSCWDEFHFTMYHGRMRNWETLPIYFGLDGWGEVEDQQKKADLHWSDD